jgi:hypothetical protein
MARPSSYSFHIAAGICQAMAEGKTLTAVCSADSFFAGELGEVAPPHISTVFRWLAANAEFRDMYARAREAQADVWANEIIDIADTPKAGVIERTDKDGNVTVETRDMIEHRRLQVDVRKWAAAKGAPKKYGDRLELAGDKDNPLVMADWATVMREERAKRLAKEPQS